MDAGGLAQMNSNNFSANGLALPGGGLASRRGGPIKPLSLSSATPTSNAADNGAPTPRTSRSHLLAGLRTAPKSATAAGFSGANVASPTTQSFARNNLNPSSNMYAQAQNNQYNGPKTALPRYAGQQQQQQFVQQPQQQQQQQQQQAHQSIPTSQHYSAEQVLAPPEIHFDEQEQMDPNLYAQLVATNMYLAQQQQRLQQQLLSVQAAAQQFQGLNLQGAQQQIQQQQLAMYQQQQQLQSIQQSMMGQMVNQQQQNVYTYYDPVTRQQGFYVDQGQNDQQQAQIAQLYAALAQQQQQQLQQQQAPRVQVSPPPENHASPFRTSTPPKRYESPSEVAPLPPPSANAFRRGHKKVMSLALNGAQANLSPSQEPPKSAGPKTASFPLTPLSGGYGPGQGRAGEHPVRQPRGPPSIEELKAKPTAKHEGSKNFATRTRRSAVHNLVRAGRERRKGTGSSNGSMSPVSESAEEESGSPITDNESDSGRSGSGSLAGDIDCSLPSSRTSTNGSWGAIGSDRPSSRQRARKSLDSVSSNESGENSFASVFKNSAQRAGIEVTDGQRKAPMLVLTSAEKRKSGILA